MSVEWQPANDTRTVVVAFFPRFIKIWRAWNLLLLDSGKRLEKAEENKIENTIKQHVEASTIKVYKKDMQISDLLPEICDKKQKIKEIWADNYVYLYQQ